MTLPAVEVGRHNAVWPIYLDTELSAKNQIRTVIVTIALRNILHFRVPVIDWH